ncbi:MAG: SapC family protein [Pseudomonadota bacterium]
MNDIQRGIVEGKLFLYEKPEMLAIEDHFDLGVSPVDAPYANTRNARAIPLTQTEFSMAQNDYPIIFTDLKNPSPLAIVGLIEDDNLFLNEKDQWEPYAYQPAYLRAYPFAFARHGEDQMAVVIDRASSMVSDQAQYPFFDDKELSEHSKKMIDFAAKFVSERRRTEMFCEKLVELDLLTAQHVSHQTAPDAEPTVVANYVSINAEKLTALDKDTVYELHTSGMLAAMYAQINSTDNWNYLLQRRARKLAG